MNLNFPVQSLELKRYICVYKIDHTNYSQNELDAIILIKKWWIKKKKEIEKKSRLHFILYLNRTNFQVLEIFSKWLCNK